MGIPRARGRKSGKVRRAKNRIGDSPRARTEADEKANQKRTDRGFPARADGRHAGIVLAHLEEGIPRARGRKGYRMFILGDIRGDSPRARTEALSLVRHSTGSRGFPARADGRSRNARRGRASMGIPRARGRKYATGRSYRRPLGDSPRARTEVGGVLGSSSSKRGFPARADGRMS